MSLTLGALPKMSVNIPYTCVKIVNTGYSYVLIRLPPARLRDISKDEAAILYTLYRHRVFGKHHMVEDNLLRGFPPNQNCDPTESAGDTETRRDRPPEVHEARPCRVPTAKARTRDR